MWVYAKMRVSRKNILFLSLLSLFLATTSASADFAAGVAAYNRIYLAGDAMGDPPLHLDPDGTRCLNFHGAT